LFRSIISVLVISLSVAGCGGKSKEDLRAEAEKQLKAGNQNGAIVLLKNALEKDGNYLDARQSLAKAYRAAGKLEQAEKEFKKLQMQDPTRAGIALELAALYNMTGRGELAVSEAQNFLKSHPDSVEAYEVLGTGHALKGNYDQAESDFLKALQLEPGRSSARISLASAYASRGKLHEAHALLDQVVVSDPKNPNAWATLANLELAMGNRDRALVCYRKITEINPADLSARFQCGMLYLDARDEANAIKMASELLSKYPKRPEGHLIRGIVLYQQKSYSDAVTELQKTLQIAKSATAYYYLGLSHYNRGELELALAQFHKSLELNPGMGKSRLIIATILLKQKMVDEAVAEGQRAVQGDPKSALAHNILGSALLAKGQFDQALREINLALDLDPKLVDAHLKKGFFSIAKGRVREGEIELDTALKVAPELLSTRYLVAAQHLRSRDYAKAVQVIREGLRGQKGDAPLYDYMAQALFADGNEAEALKSLQKAKEADPAYYAPYFTLALYQVAKKAPDKALAEYAEVLKRDPKNLQALLRTAEVQDAQSKPDLALATLRRAKDTGNPEGALALANYLVARKEPGQALDVLDAALKAQPHHAGLWALKGKTLGSQKKFREALACFEEVEATAPEQALPLKVVTCLALKDFPKAQESARALIRRKPASADGYVALSLVYQAQDDLGRAADALRDGLKADPGNNQVHMALGELCTRKKDYPAALGCYLDLLKRQPGYLPALFAKGAVYERMGKKADAVRAYQESLRLSRDFVPALNNLAYLYATGLGSKGEALKLAGRAYQLDNKSGGVMDTMGYCLLVNGKKDDARKLLEQAATALPKDPTVHYHLALAYREGGNRAQALKSLQKSLDLGDFPEANAARQLLAQLKG